MEVSRAESTPVGVSHLPTFRLRSRATHKGPLNLQHATELLYRDLVRQAIEQTKNSREAAAALGISLRCLYDLKRKLRLAQRQEPWTQVEKEYWRRTYLSEHGREWEHPTRPLYNSREAWLQQRQQRRRPRS